MVVVKDMSRFGRDYLQVGMYTEVLFPEKDIHFVAINDGVDSEKGDNDFTPLRNLFNEWYARDTSTFDRVQVIRQGKCRHTKIGTVGLFSGLLFCADCGSKMYHHRGSGLKESYEYYTCAGYSMKNCPQQHPIDFAIRWACKRNRENSHLPAYHHHRSLNHRIVIYFLPVVVFFTI